MSSTISQARLRELVTYNPTTGDFYWLRTPPGRKTPSGKAGTYCKRTRCWKISLDGKRYLGHRLAWLYVHGTLGKGKVSHVNGDLSDNRIENLTHTS